MNKAIIGRKLGMTQLFKEDGKVIPVTVIDSNQVSLVKVGNDLLTELPETGGMGTTLFYVTGSIIMLLAAALIMGRRKEEE